jgi:hypothetical protein
LFYLPHRAAALADNFFESLIEFDVQVPFLFFI